MTVLGNDVSFMNYIVYLNTQKQLYKQGKDAKGRLLDEVGGSYSPYTIDKKKQKGEITDHVTLKDTGDFYNSFRAYVDGNKDIVVSADTIKDTTDLLTEWGGAILGLNEESKIEMKKEALKVILPYVRKQLLSR